MFNGFVYLWLNLTNGKRYIGSHWGQVDDGYVGSGVLFRRAVKKYGLRNFRRVILEQREYRDRKELQEAEFFFLKNLRVVEKDLYYNLTDNAGASLRSKEAREKQAAAMRGRKQTSSQVLKRMVKMRGENHPQFKGYWLTPAGKFVTAKEAARYNDCSYRTVMDRCKAGKPGWSFEEKRNAHRK